jgi:hypothetical protein
MSRHDPLSFDMAGDRHADASRARFATHLVALLTPNEPHPVASEYDPWAMVLRCGFRHAGAIPNTPRSTNKGGRRSGPLRSPLGIRLCQALVRSGPGENATPGTETENASVRRRCLAPGGP